MSFWYRAATKQGFKRSRRDQRERHEKLNNIPISSHCDPPHLPQLGLMRSTEDLPDAKLLASHDFLCLLR